MAVTVQEAIRPTHQAAIEAASNQGDYTTVGKIIQGMDDGDPYKKSMISLFRNQVLKAGIKL